MFNFAIVLIGQPVKLSDELNPDPSVSSYLLIWVIAFLGSANYENPIVLNYKVWVEEVPPRAGMAFMSTYHSLTISDIVLKFTNFVQP